MPGMSRIARLRLVLATTVTAGALLAGCGQPATPPLSDTASVAPASPTISSPASSSAASSSAASSGASATADDEAVVEAATVADGDVVGRPAGTRTVTRIVDGDTFEVDGGDRVRVLGIDSCEAGTTRGGAATGAASLVLYGTTVTLSSEPGVDRDRYGRMLRYVAMNDGRDFGRYMVALDHTGVYEGRNDANAGYVRSLRAADPNGRVCGTDTTTTPRPSEQPKPAPKPQPDPAPRTTQAPAPAPSGGGAAYYKNCKAARAAGAAPLRVGEAGYRSALDRDNDGVACE